MGIKMINILLEIKLIKHVGTCVQKYSWIVLFFSCCDLNFSSCEVSQIPSSHCLITAICSTSPVHYYGATTLMAVIVTQHTSLPLWQTDLASFISSSEMASIKYAHEFGNEISVYFMGIMDVYIIVLFGFTSIFGTHCYLCMLLDWLLTIKVNITEEMFITLKMTAMTVIFKYSSFNFKYSSR